MESLSVLKSPCTDSSKKFYIASFHQEVVTEKITKLSQSNSVVYIEASEVRKLKAIDENGREHEVREKAMEEEARRLEERLEERLDDEVVTTEVTVEVINSTERERDIIAEKPPVKQAYFMPECRHFLPRLSFLIVSN